MGSPYIRKKGALIVKGLLGNLGNPAPYSKVIRAPSSKWDNKAWGCSRIRAFWDPQDAERLHADPYEGLKRILLRTSKLLWAASSKVPQASVEELFVILESWITWPELEYGPEHFTRCEALPAGV